MTEFLEGCLDPATFIPYRRREHREMVAANRALAVSNLVAGLSAFSGMAYGTNVVGWREWLESQSAHERASPPDHAITP
jgi:hypothetical protein